MVLVAHLRDLEPDHTDSLDHIIKLEEVTADELPEETTQDEDEGMDEDKPEAMNKNDSAVSHQEPLSHSMWHRKSNLLCNELSDAIHNRKECGQQNKRLREVQRQMRHLQPYFWSQCE